MSALTYNAFVPANPVAESLQRAGLSLGNALLFVGEILVKAYKLSQTRSQLHSLSNEQLADIGLERFDIDRKVAAL